MLLFYIKMHTVQLTLFNSGNRSRITISSKMYVSCKKMWQNSWIIIICMADFPMGGIIYYHSPACSELAAEVHQREAVSPHILLPLQYIFQANLTPKHKINFITLLLFFNIYIKSSNQRNNGPYSCKLCRHLG